MTKRWPRERIQGWYAEQPWLCGFNYLPHTAVNWIDMWQGDTFDAATIEAEFALAEQIGFNTLRTNLHSLVWHDDPAGLRSRIDRFLGIASRHGLRAMLCLFDDCGFSGQEPRLGAQGDPIPGVHNSRACASPGRAVVRDRTCWALLEDYVGDIVGHFRDDARVLAWDLYNEPGNNSVFGPFGLSSEAPLLPHSMDLVRSAFEWARGVEPVQPLTTGIFNPSWPEENAVLAELSDFVTFHNYLDLGLLQAQVAFLRSHGRPLMCTEWLARGLGSLPHTHLPYFKSERIGCYHWGLVNGRTQTHLPWPGLAGAVDATVWQHDLFHSDGRPYDTEELEVFRQVLGSRGVGDIRLQPPVRR